MWSIETKKRKYTHVALIKPSPQPVQECITAFLNPFVLAPKTRYHFCHLSQVVASFFADCYIMNTGLHSHIQMPSRTTSPGPVDSDVDDSRTSSTFSRSRNSDTPISQGELDQDDTDNDFEQPSLDDGGIDEGIVVKSGASSSTSLTPSAYEDEVTHGRRYHGFQRGRYPLPNDELEQRREETKHVLMLELTVCTSGFADND